MSRKVFYDGRRAATFADWKQWAQDQELRVEDFARRVRDAVTVLTDPLTVAERTIVNSVAGSRIVLDFRLAQAYTLILNASAAEVVFIPPTIGVGRATTFRLEIKHGVAGALITTWTNVVFYAPDSAYMSSGLPVLSAVAGYTDVVAFTFKYSDQTIRGMFTPGAAA
jgi:hypothetical protein